MKIKNTSFKLLILALAFGIALTSCTKEGLLDNQPEDITIPIDDNSAFNMNNFIISFDQIFSSQERWAWSYTHDYVDGKALTSHSNYKVYGGFADEMMETTHIYNTEGVVISSERATFGEDGLSFTYEYDLSGFIVKISKEFKGEIRDVVVLEYDGNNLLKKTHEDGDVETFTYNADNLVSSYTIETVGEETELTTYSYSNGNMTRKKEYFDGELEYSIDFDYDSDNRIIKATNDDSDYSTLYEYSSNLLTEINYDNSLLTSKKQYKKGFIRVKSWSYNYNGSDVFEYCMVREHDGDADHNVVKKSYYEGSVSDLVLVGYATVDSRDFDSSLKTMESIYNSNGTKIYYVIHTISYDNDSDRYEISRTNWNEANGTSIDSGDITEEWVFVLVR